MDKVGKNVRKRVKEKPFLPDEIITNILIRLPVKSVVKFEIVCRKWRDIILARDFVDLHQRSSIPVIIVKSSFKGRLHLFAVDKWWDVARTRSMIHRFPSCAVDFPFTSVELFSHAGLIVLRRRYTRPDFFILNPARPSHECVKIDFSEFRADICAVYYHPSLKEYCSLWIIDKPVRYSLQLVPIQCKLLNLGSNPSLKTISDSFDYRVKPKDAYPLFVNNHLYWMLKSERKGMFGGCKDILEFDIISEEFKVIPCPIPLITECNKHQTHLLNSDGVISFVLILPSTITIWRLEDRIQQVWTSIEYTISLEVNQDSKEFGLIAVVDGKLAFKSGKRLFVCNLIDGTVKKYPKKCSGSVFFWSHQMTLASLKNCKHELYIERDGKVVGGMRQTSC